MKNPDDFNKNWLWILAAMVLLHGVYSSSEPEIVAARESKQVFVGVAGDTKSRK